MSGPEQRVHQLLRERAIEWPAPIHHLDSVSSTNDWLKERARSAPEWTVVMADVQTTGRGRHGRRWVSQRGDLALSVLVRPTLPADSLTVLPLAAGLAVAEAAGELGAETWLKWPNDVVTTRARGGDGAYHKLGGILVEGVSDAQGLQAAVVGVGLNLNEPPADELRATATSLRAHTGREQDREAAAAAVLARLRVCYDAVARGDAGAIVAAWIARALPWWGRVVEVRSGDVVLQGTARGVDGRGALLLELADGTTAAVVSGEARRVRLSGRKA